jgi:hypothetical protein
MSNYEKYVVIKDLTLPSSSGKIRTLTKGSIVEDMKNNRLEEYSGYRAVFPDFSTILSYKIVQGNPEYFAPINPPKPQLVSGQVWVNCMGYHLIVLDVGVEDVWLEYENGNKGSWKKEKFLYDYKLKKEPSHAKSDRGNIKGF